MSIFRYCLWAGLSASLFASSGQAATRELTVGARFSGTLTENMAPCTIHPGDETITLPLSAVNLATADLNSEGPRHPFTIRLENCSLDTDVAGRVEVFLSGQADSEGRLQFDPGSTGAGLVVGIENAQGAPLSLNAASPAVTLPLNASEIAIEMQAYLKAVNGAALVTGDFTASLNYIISYP